MGVLSGVRHCLVQGASRGIGLEFTSQLLQRNNVAKVVATSRDPAQSDGLKQLQEQYGSRLVLQAMDVTSEESISHAASAISSQVDKQLDLVINVSGVLHAANVERMPERRLADIDSHKLDLNFRVNAFSQILVAKHFEAQLKHKHPAVFASLSARVGSISDNGIGGWYSYRASKAAQNMMMKTLAIEWQRTHKNVKVLQLHPGTVDTDLSAPFKGNVKPEKLFSTTKSVNCLLSVIDTATETGRFYAWDGEEIPW